MGTPLSGRRRTPGSVLAVHVFAFAAVLVFVEALRLGVFAELVPLLVFDRGYEDFDHAYYPAGRLIRDNPQALYAGESYGGSGEPVLDTTTAGYFVNIPIVAWLFAPFTLIPSRIAGDLFLASNVILSIVSLVLVQQRISPTIPALRWLVTAAFASSGPLLSALHLGQTTPGVLLVLLLAERCLHRGREAAAGVWLALACIVKIPPFALLAVFAWQRRWRLLAATAAVIAIIGLASLGAYGWSLHTGYVDAAFGDYVGVALPSHDCQSIVSVLARLTTDAPLWSWKPVPLSPAASAIHRVVAIGILAVMLWALFRAGRDTSHAALLLGASLVLCATLLILPVYWTHYGTWLLPVAVVAAGAGLTRPRPGVLAATAVAMLLINVPIPPRAIIESASDEPWFRLLISHQAAGTLVLLGVCAWRLHRLQSEAPAERRSAG